MDNNEKQDQVEQRRPIAAEPETKTDKPVAVKPASELEAVQDSTPTEAPKPAPTAAPEADKPTAPVAEAVAQRVDTPSSAGMAVSGSAVDDVFLSKCVYKNAYSQKSLTVHHVQRRLVELGYNVAGADKDGWYGDHTKSAVSEFQRSAGLIGDGSMDMTTLDSLFKNDSNVRVNP